jgi:methionyl-tRNA synthetase
MEKIFVAVAWPYANGDVHVGHFGGTLLPADIFARYNRLIGNEVLMVSGSDMHGTPITLTAEKEHLEPYDVAMKFHLRNKEAIEKSGISFDIYTNTHTENHQEIVKDIFTTLYNKGFVYKKIKKSPYCEVCHRFLADRYIVGECPYCHSLDAHGNECDQCGRTLEAEELLNPRCKICNSVPVIKDEEEFYFKLSDFSDKIKDYLSDKKYWKENAIKFTNNYLADGLKDRAITRELNWGVKVPLNGYENKVIYVWFEAVCGYLSASIEYSAGNKKEVWKKFWYDQKAKHYYFMGKDNIIFHTILWPSILMGYDKNLALPYDIPSNEYVKMGDSKFSKSKGIEDKYTLIDIVSKYPADMIRYYMTIHMPEHHDTLFDFDEMVKQYNEIVVDSYGNLIHRILSFYYSHFRDHSTSPMNILGIGEDIEGAMDSVEVHISNCQFKEALETIQQLVFKGNKLFNDLAPWNKIKESPKETKAILDDFVWLAKALLIMMSPFMPFSSEKGLKYLGENTCNCRWDDILEPPIVSFNNPPSPLFQKITIDKEPMVPALRVGKIVEVNEVQDSDKLYKLKVSLGSEERTVVAGIRKYYNKENLLGKKIIFVSNLEYKKIKGIKSEGMLLAASNQDTVSLLTVDTATEGEYIDGFYSKSTITFEKFKNFEIEVVDLMNSKAISKKGTYDVPLKDTIKGVMLHNNTDHVLLLCNGSPVHPDKELPAGSMVS